MSKEELCFADLRHWAGLPVASPSPAQLTAQYRNQPPRADEEELCT